MTLKAGCDVIEPGASSVHESLLGRSLRRKILEAVDRGMPKSEAAKTFGVSRSSIKRYAAARREGKPLAPKKHPGSKPKLDERRPQSSWKPTWKRGPPSPSKTDVASLRRWRGSR
jgi:transposase